MGVDNLESEGCLFVSEGLVVGIVTKVVQSCRVSGVMVVMVVDSAKLGMSMGIMT